METSLHPRRTRRLTGAPTLLHADAGAVRPVLLLALLIGLGVGFGVALLLNAGGGGDAPTAAATTGGITRDGDPDARAELPAPDAVGDPQAATDPEAALRGFLAAEAAQEWEVSYEYLTQELRATTYTSPAAWVSAHADFPQVTAYEIRDVAQAEEGEEATVTTLTGFDPVLDPVLGLVPARGRTTWVLERDAEGLWRVDASETASQPLYPSSDGAEGTARAWVDARTACDDSSGLEAGLIGTRALAAALCEEDQPGEVVIGPVGALTDSAAAATLLSEFGPEVYNWARTVEVGAASPFTLVLGPVGQEWRVVAVLNQS